MSLNTFSFIKLKKKCQDTFYNSIESTLNLKNPQTYIPAFSQYVKFKNDFSKKMFILKNKYIVLKLEKRQDTKNDINKKHQGEIYAYIVDRNIYVKSSDFNGYKNYIKCIPIFIKSNPLLDVIYYMEGKYENNNNIPSIFSFLTSNKINSINNNAYIEVITAYFLNLLNENKKCTLFPYYFGSFNGIAENYTHDISEDYPHLVDSNWFDENSDKYEIIRNNNLEDFEELSLKNIVKIDYNTEKNNYNSNLNIDIGIDINESDIEVDIEPIYDNKKIINNLKSNENVIIKAKNINNSNNPKKLRNKLYHKTENNINNDSDDDSCNNSDNEYESDDDYTDIDSDDSSFCSSNASCIMNETFVNIMNFPIEILCMEKFDITLTKLVKEGIKNNEWKSILFEICFGMAIAQKHYSFVHNDLHSDNIMFKDIEKEYKYYKYENINTYFKVPTYKRETKVIDFARGIIKVGKKTYFSDVFKKDGDAGGQYNYLNKFKKKLNFSFDLARLGTTINEYLCGDIELLETFKFVNLWCIDKKGDNFNNMEDDFSLYINICKNAKNAIPRIQLENEYFKEYIIEPTKIPNNEHIYYL